MTARPDSGHCTPLARLRRASRWPALLAVLAFGLRALVPTGFMLAPVDGHVQWTLCPDAGAHAHHHHAGMPAGHAQQLHCPFALASAAPLAAALPALVPPHAELRLPVAEPARPGRAADSPYRHAAARGPPTLA